jgi:hypothetical protein
LGIVGVAAVLAFPPYMVIDRAAPATRHSGLAHHPAWSPPTPAAAEEVLSQRFGPPPSEATSSLDIRRNSVLLTLEIVLILLIASSAWLVAGRTGRTG